MKFNEHEIDMSALKSILLHMDASPDGADRLRCAMRLARTNAADLTALYAVLPTYLQYPYAMAISADAASAYQQFDDERAARAKALFGATVGTDASGIRWAEAVGEPVSAFTRQAFCADLLVLARSEPDEAAKNGVPPDFIESVLIDSGTPALVLPRGPLPATLGRVALVAWKETRESARALRAALPLLQQAEHVEVASWGDDATLAGGGPLNVEQLLRSHGINARIHRHGNESAELGEYLLSLTVDVGADLLVMGCYGHSRARELVLGGATRTVLKSLTLPVLMAH
jgi:nucleotide-binding universal stress UspA family protein